MERRLGRGLESLLGGAAAEPQGAPGGLPESLPLIKVRPNPGQPRKVFDSSALEELRDSIRRHGVIQPICVRRTDGGYEIVAGERRWRAARMAGLDRVPAIVLEDEGQERFLEVALVENLQREDLHPLEKAHAFKDLQQTFNLTQAQVAERVGMKRATVTNHLRLLDLPDEAQEAVAAGLITMGHAKALLSLKEPGPIRAALLKVVKEDLSVRQLERHVAAGEAAPTGEVEAQEARAARIPPWVHEIEGRMRDNLGTRVSIQNRPGFKGQIVIRYHDRDELDRLCAQLAPADRLS